MCLAVPAEVTALTGVTATVSVEGAFREVDVSLVDGVAVGDYVLVHAGFALHRWDLDQVLEWRAIMGEMTAGEEPR
ncbi:MAG: HypC/HybG/HupF family hydrogenase formation chaperone [bacterium]